MYVVVESQLHEAQSVLRCGGGLGAVHLFKCKEIAFEGARHLLFHLLSGGSGINGHHHTLAYDELWELVFRHYVHAEYSHDKQQQYDEQRDRVVLQRPANPIYVLHLENE